MNEKVDWFIEKKIMNVMKKAFKGLFLMAIVGAKRKMYLSALLHKAFYGLKLHMKMNKIKR